MTNGVQITVENSNISFHSFDDYGLVIENNNYIGAPVQETNYVTIAGASIDLDMSEALTGKPIFKSREITINFGGKRNKAMWDSVISDIRNKIDGRVCRLVFDNDKSFYWRGRVTITDFDRTLGLGRFTLTMGHADPYKYDKLSSLDRWEWDPFDFEISTIREIGTITVDGSASVLIPKGNMDVVPVFEVRETQNDLYVTVDGVSRVLDVGTNRYPQIKVAGASEVTLEFTGHGTLDIDYRGGSL